MEQKKKFGIRIKPPKTKRGLRTIDLEDGTIALLLQAKERPLRLHAGLQMMPGLIRPWSGWPDDDPAIVLRNCTKGKRATQADEKLSDNRLAKPVGAPSKSV